MNEECIHGLGDPAWCTICNGRESRAEKEAKTVKYKFTAKFDSRCYSCWRRIDAGDEIARMLDGSVKCRDCAT